MLHERGPSGFPERRSRKPEVKKLSISDILSYINHKTKQRHGGTRELITLGEMYGTEHFCLFLHSLIKLEKPRVVVELGTGSGGTAALCGLAVKELGRGHVWTVDDGAEWHQTRDDAQGALGYTAPDETHAAFMKKFLRRFALEKYVTCSSKRMTEQDFFSPGKPIDILFADAQSSSAIGCLHLLRYYLAKMSTHSSIFIDRASTINHAALFLNYLVGQLQAGKIPGELRTGTPPATLRRLQHLVETSKFTIIHLTEPRYRKSNEMQNSRAWIKIEPNHFLFRDEVDSYIGSNKAVKVRYSGK